MRLTLAARRLFERGLDDAALLRGLRATPSGFRTNTERVLAAARLAASEGRRLALVEGWRANVIATPPARTARVVTGSWLAALILRLLVRRGLVPPGLRVLRRSISRCTLEETRVAAALSAGGDLIVVAGRAAPSAWRATQYLRGGTVLTPADALRRAGGCDARTAAVLAAIALGPGERLAALALETLAWATHAVSLVESRLGRPRAPLELRLAHRLRPDRTSRHIPARSSAQQLRNGRARP